MLIRETSRPGPVLSLRTSLLLVAATLGLSGIGHGQDDTGSASVSLEELTSSVYIALQPSEGRFNDANSILVETEREWFLIDLPSNRTNAQAILDQASALIADSKKELRFLINTHWHSDHSQSNYLAVDHAARLGSPIMILGHETLLEEIPERAGGYIEEQINRYEEALPPGAAAPGAGSGARRL